MTASPDKPTREEVLGLAQRVCDETISPDERERLEAILGAHGELRRDYLDYLTVNANLISRYRTGDSERSGESHVLNSGGVMGGGGRNLAAWATFFVLSACVLLMLGLNILADRETPVAADEKPAAAARQIATLRDSSAVLWREGDLPVNVGDRLPSGELNLSGGRADLVLDSGVRLVLEGPALLKINSPEEAFLRSGKVAVHVPERAIGFTLLTPTSKLIDQGTEFGVVAEDDGATEVHVFRGQVDLVYADATEKLKESRFSLLGRQARRVIEHNSKGHDIDFSLDRFRGIAERVNEPIKWPISKGGNGHYYQLVFYERAVTWQEAAADAYNRHHMGMPGHLVSVTTEAEHQFVLTQLIGDRRIDNIWIGLTDVLREGFYQWITGEPFEYEQWGAEPVQQPDNFIERDGHGGEDYCTYSSLPVREGWFWNDLSNDSIHQSVAAAIIEYEPPTTDVVQRTMLSVPVTWKAEEGGNNHLYRLGVSLQPLDWHDVKKAAEATTLIGIRGQLASLETEAERRFVSDNIFRVCGIAENLLGLSRGDDDEVLRWESGVPLDDVLHASPRNKPVGGVYGQYRWMNLAWTLQTVPFERAQPGWFGYLVEYPVD